MRLAYYARLREPRFVGIISTIKRACVKESRFVGEHNSLRAHEIQAQIRAVAIFLAREFSVKVFQNKINSKKVIYVPVKLVTISSSSSENSHYSMEPYLEGEYIKFNNNMGWVNKEQESLHPILQTFSHFTFCYTTGTVMVTDIQGVVYHDSYRLTDPAIHTGVPETILKDPTNQGTTGMNAFFLSHICNDFCKRLGLYLPTDIDASIPLDLTTSSTAEFGIHESEDDSYLETD